jgi:hypothetical protein
VLLGRGDEVLVPGLQAFALVLFGFDLGCAGIVVAVCDRRLRRLGPLITGSLGVLGFLAIGGRFGDRGFEGGDDSGVDGQSEFLVLEQLADPRQLTAFAMASSSRSGSMIPPVEWPGRVTGASMLIFVWSNSGFGYQVVKPISEARRPDSSPSWTARPRGPQESTGEDLLRPRSSAGTVKVNS